MHSVSEEMARAGAFAAIVRGLVRTDGSAGNLTHHGGEDDIAFERNDALLQRLAGDHESGQATLHVRDTEPLDLVADNAAFKFGFRLDMGHHSQICAGSGE